MAAASAAGSRGGASQPVAPGTMVSRAPPWSVATTGRPIAWASMITRPKPSGKGDDLLALDPVRIERGDVDPARDDPQPVGADPIDLGDVLADEMRDRDDPLAARHYRIVPVLQRQIGVVGIVKRRHEAPPRRTRGRPGAPRRSAAAGMHDVDLVAADDLRERGDIAAHHQRVLRGEREL